MQSNPPGGQDVTGVGAAHIAAQAAAHVLVVDDDPTVAEVVAGYLDRAGHDVARAADGPSALAHFARRQPDLVVLDLMLPGMDGFEVCRRMRERGGPVPVIMLTARGDEEDRVLGLETGADDYVTKPFSPRELVLRVESVLRRARLPVPAPGSSPAANVLRTATLTLDPTARRATREGAELALTLREFDLLAFFLRHPGRAFSREELMSEVWGWDFGDLSTVTVHVRRLRTKIEPDPARPSLIQTVWGVGYRLSSGTATGPGPGQEGDDGGGSTTPGGGGGVALGAPEPSAGARVVEGPPAAWAGPPGHGAETASTGRITPPAGSPPSGDRTPSDTAPGGRPVGGALGADALPAAPAGPPVTPPPAATPAPAPGSAPSPHPQGPAHP